MTYAKSGSASVSEMEKHVAEGGWGYVIKSNRGGDGYKGACAVI